VGIGHAFTPFEANQQSSLVGTIWLQFSLDRYMTYSMTRLPLEASGFHQGARQTAVASSSWVKTIADLRRPPWLGSTLGDSPGSPSGYFGRETKERERQPRGGCRFAY